MIDLKTAAAVSAAHNQTNRISLAPTTPGAAQPHIMNMRTLVVAPACADQTSVKRDPL
jgi:hypothetical protein